MLLLNIRTLTNQNKLINLLNLVNFHDIEVLFLTETWLDERYDNQFCSLFGVFNVISRKDRLVGSYGGVLSLVRNSAPR